MDEITKKSIVGIGYAADSIQVFHEGGDSIHLTINPYDNGSASIRLGIEAVKELIALLTPVPALLEQEREHARIWNEKHRGGK